MIIGGLQKVSLIDYPGRISAVVFTQGCNFRCPFCHNPELVDPARFGPVLDEQEVLRFLETRRDKLEGVSITGGEPTIQPDLAVFARQLKEMGFLVKIDTNGSRPDVLEELIAARLIDFIAMDVKGPLKKYAALTGAVRVGPAIRRSIELVRDSGLASEFRTTAVPSLLTEKDFHDIGKLIEKAARFVLQRYARRKQLDPAFPPAGAQEPNLEACAKILERYAAQVRIR